jgi:hypothetical protein
MWDMLLSWHIAQGNMWASSQFEAHLAELTGDPACWRDRVQPQIRAAVLHSLEAASVVALLFPMPQRKIVITEN